MSTHVTVEIFSQIWWTSIILTSALIILVVKWSKCFDEIKKNSIAKFIGCILLFIALYINVYQILKGEWNIQSSLPLNLCSLSGWLSGLVLLFPNQIAFEFLLFWGIPGAFHSFITPELTLGSQGWYLYDYYISHGGIILSVVYLRIILKFRPRAYSWLTVFCWSQLLLLIVYLFDYFAGSNYMYLINKPIANNPLIIGDWPAYILILDIIGCIHMYLVYQIFKKRNALYNLQ